MQGRQDRNVRRTRVKTNQLTGSRIGIIGGSLGGLSAACLLRDAGHDVTVFERSKSELEERGAGIGLLETTYRYLVDRAKCDVSAISVETQHIRYLNRDNSVVHDSQHHYLFSSWNTIYSELLQHFDRDRYLLGHHCVDFGSDKTSAWAKFDNDLEFTGDLLLAADGIGSLFRSRLLPDAQPRYAGYVAWRGMVSESDLSAELVQRLGDAITYYVYANSHILVYPIPNVDGSNNRGERLINFVWYRNYLEGGELDDLLTDSNGQRRQLSVPPGLVAEHHVDELRAQAQGRLPPILASLVDAVEQPFLQVIYDIEVDRVVFDRVCLMGDAAFAVRPHAAAGTAKAADDAWAFSRAFEKHESIDTALAEFEPTQVQLGRELLERTRVIGHRSQVENTWEPGDPDFIFGLYGPGK